MTLYSKKSLKMFSLSMSMIETYRLVIKVVISSSIHKNPNYLIRQQTG